MEALFFSFSYVFKKKQVGFPFLLLIINSYVDFLNRPHVCELKKKKTKMRYDHPMPKYNYISQPFLMTRLYRPIYLRICVGLSFNSTCALIVSRILFFWKPLSPLFHVWQAFGKLIKRNSISVNRKIKTLKEESVFLSLF